MKSLVRLSLIVALSLTSLPTLGGDGDTDQRFSTDVTMAGVGTNGDFLPLFLTASEYGIVGTEDDQFYLRIKNNYRLDRHHFHLDAVADVVAYATTENPYYGGYLNLQQLYARASWKKFFVMAGRMERKQHIVTRYQSSGNMVLSANALPAIGIGGGFKDYIPMRVMDDKIEVFLDGFFGRQTDGKYNAEQYRIYESNYGPQGINDPRRHGSGVSHHLIQNAWIHYATLLLRSQSDLPFYVLVGIEHGAMYGGKVDGISQNSVGSHFLAALGGKGKGKNGLNAQWNHLLAYDARLKYKRKRWSTALYRQIYADDMDANVFRSGLDGLTGLELRFNRKPFFKLITLEYLQTTRQGGVVYANDVYWYDKVKNPNRSQHLYETAGNSNFYHDEWYGAWAHRGKGIGNPLIPSPAYNQDGYNDYKYNVVRAFHLGMTGRFIEDLSYRLRYCFQKTWGTPYQPIHEALYNNSGNFDLIYDWGQWQFLARVAYDHGKIYGNQWGYSFAVTHKGEVFHW